MLYSRGPKEIGRSVAPEAAWIRNRAHRAWIAAKVRATIAARVHNFRWVKKPLRAGETKRPTPTVGKGRALPRRGMLRTARWVRASTGFIASLGQWPQNAGDKLKTSRILENGCQVCSGVFDSRGRSECATRGRQP